MLGRLLQLLPRSLSAEALTALLATFSALFKYVLVPAVEVELLSQAWTAFVNVLPQCHPEVQRATAEVWGATLRRLKLSLREDAVRMVAGCTDSGLGDACAWIFVTACKVRGSGRRIVLLPLNPVAVRFSNPPHRHGKLGRTTRPILPHVRPRRRNVYASATRIDGPYTSLQGA